MSKTVSGYTIKGGTESKIKRMTEFLEDPSIQSRTLDIEPATSHDWDLPYESGFYGIPDGKKKYAIVKATIKTEDWLQFQMNMHNCSTPEQFEQAAYEQTITSVAKDIQSGDVEDIPTPVLTVNDTYAEGRSRGLGAKEGGLERMPIWIIVE